MSQPRPQSRQSPDQAGLSVRSHQFESRAFETACHSSERKLCHLCSKRSLACCSRSQLLAGSITRASLALTGVSPFLRSKVLFFIVKTRYTHSFLFTHQSLRDLALFRHVSIDASYPADILAACPLSPQPVPIYPRPPDSIRRT